MEPAVRVLMVHPSPLLYTEVYLRLEPLGVERVAGAAEAAGHEVRLLDLQIFKPGDLKREVREFKPRCVAFGVNYLANIPEVIDLCKWVKEDNPDTFCIVGGHSASFVAEELIEHGDGAIDAVIRGEGEVIFPRVLEALGDPQLATLPGVVTRDGTGPQPTLLENLDACPPARHLTRRRRNYFIGILDPCASIEMTRGCPWDCSFCSAWTFYGRSYRKSSPEAVAEEMASIEEPNVFLVDDVAFIHPEHGFAIGRELEKRRIKKEYYLETRCDVLIRHHEVFRYWKRLGLHYMFLGLEAIDAEGLSNHRKRVNVGENERALEIARDIGMTVAVNIIADPSWDEERFRVIQEWALEVPEIVHLTVATPYPGTELWLTEQRRLTTHDYRLFDVQHAVVPTKLPLPVFYRKLVETQEIISRKHMSFAAFRATMLRTGSLFLRGQTNFARMLWKFTDVYDAGRFTEEHDRPVRYAMRPPPAAVERVAQNDLFVHVPEKKRTTPVLT